MKKIDIHVHVRQYLAKYEEETAILRPSSKDTYITPEQLKVLYDKLGIEKGVLLPGESPEGKHYSVTNQETMRIAKDYPDMFYWFCSVDPRWDTNRPDTDLSYYINYFKSHGAKGIGELTAKLPFDEPRMKNLFYHAEKCDMPVLFHVGTDSSSYGAYDILGLHKLESVLSEFPKLIFIGHSQPFWAEIGDDVTQTSRNGYPKGPINKEGRVVELMRKYPNLHADLSANSGYNAVSRDPDFGYSFLEEFKDRIYYGTDICANRNYEFFKLADFLKEGKDSNKLSKEAYELICRSNALNLLER